jgi:hypothetical protein
MDSLLPGQSPTQCPQRLKPGLIRTLTARLKSCPSTKPSPKHAARMPYALGLLRHDGSRALPCAGPETRHAVSLRISPYGVG